jgi:hypothetical protein
MVENYENSKLLVMEAVMKANNIKEYVEIIDVERYVPMLPWESPMQKIKIKRKNGEIETRVDNEVGLGPFGGAGCPDEGRDWQKDKDKGEKLLVTLRNKVKGIKRTEDWININ